MYPHQIAQRNAERAAVLNVLMESVHVRAMLRSGTFSTFSTAPKDTCVG